MVCSKISTLFEARLYEARLQKSLKEKETLLKEIHHRVKNNMQIISSLLSLQTEYLETDNDKELFLSNQRRIMSMALVHEQLYKSQSFSRINFSKYIDNLTREILQHFSIEVNKITLDINAGDINLNMDQALPCAMIINEIISNSLIHGYPDGTLGTIKIFIVKDKNNTITLKISDDGKGIPPELVNENCSSLGMQLIFNLTRQLNGTIKYTKRKGSHFTIVFNGKF